MLCGVLVSVVCERILCGITWLQSDRYSVWDHFVIRMATNTRIDIRISVWVFK